MRYDQYRLGMSTVGGEFSGDHGASLRGQGESQVFRILHENQVACLGRLQACDTAHHGVSIPVEGSTQELRDVFDRALHGSCIAAVEEEGKFPNLRAHPYNPWMQRKIFWLVVVALELAGFWLPFWWQVFAIVPIVWIAWWVAYRSDWF